MGDIDMFSKSAFAATAMLCLSSTAYAQEAALLAPAASTAEPAVAPLQVMRAAAQPAAVLPANTEVLLSMNQEVTTKGKTWSEGDTFDMSVVHDVMYGNYVVIPKGTRGVGRITWMTSKGMFGKSGKMDIEIDYLELGGRRIPLQGTYRQEGEGNTVATVGGVILAGVFAGFITGKSGRIPQGRELLAHTEADIPLAIEGPIPAREAPVVIRQPAAAGTSQTMAQPFSLPAAGMTKGQAEPSGAAEAHTQDAAVLVPVP